MRLGWKYPAKGFSSLKKLWYMYPNRIINAFRKAFLLCRETRSWRLLWMFKITLKNNQAFVAHEVYPNRFSIRGHMTIEQEETDYYTEDYYLNPSQKFLDRELSLLLVGDIKDYNPAISEDYQQFNWERAAKYLEWRNRMIEKGFQIGYIASLDT